MAIMELHIARKMFFFRHQTWNISASLSLERLRETSFLCFFTMVNFHASTTQHLEWIQWQQTRINYSTCALEIFIVWRSKCDGHTRIKYINTYIYDTYLSHHRHQIFTSILKQYRSTYYNKPNWLFVSSFDTKLGKTRTPFDLCKKRSLHLKPETWILILHWTWHCRTKPISRRTNKYSKGAPTALFEAIFLSA